jgi:hypothetical protein
MPPDTPFRNPPSQHFQPFSDHGPEDDNEEYLTPDFAGPGLGLAPVFRPYLRQSVQRPRMNTGCTYSSHPPAFGSMDDSPYAGSSESSGWMNWRGENVTADDRSRSPYVPSGPPGTSYSEQSIDPSLAPRTSEIRELLARVSRLEDMNVRSTKALEEVAGRLEKAEARLKALGEAPEGGVTGGNTALNAERVSKGRGTMRRSLKVCYFATLPVVLRTDAFVSPFCIRCSMRCVA